MDISNSDSTKGKIIEILSYEWPLSLRKIHYLLKKRGSSVTYQATHKAITQLIGAKKLKKTYEGYTLNLEWIKEIHDKTEIIRVNYFSKKRSFLTLGEDDKENIQTFLFKNWFDLEKYIYYLQKKVLKNERKNQTSSLKTNSINFNEIDKLKLSICMHHHHEWRPLFYLRAEYNWIKWLKNAGYNLYTISAGKTVLDTWSKKFYENLDNNMIIGVGLNGPSEIIVFHDLVVQVYIPFELLDKLDAYLNKNKRIEELNTGWLIENIFEKETEIKVIINKDIRLADEIRNHTLAHFKK
jgi:hypothetical protein